MSALRVMGAAAEDAHRERARRPRGRGTFSQRAVHRTAHGNHLTSSQTNDDPAAGTSMYALSSPSSRPRDEGCAAGVRTREDVRLPQEQRSEDRRKGGLTTYEYDLYGNLLRVDLPDGRAIEYEVDGAGRRVGRRELDADGFEISFRGWIYRDLLRPIAEVDSQGNVVARYVYDGGASSHQNGLLHLEARMGLQSYPVLQSSAANHPSYAIFGDPSFGSGRSLNFITDHLGTVILGVDIETGEVLRRNEFTDFGSLLRTAGTADVTFGFAGGMTDPDAQFVRFGARDYLPEIGLWAARDPMRFEGGDNGYMYSDADPVNKIDPFGYRSQDPSCKQKVRWECRTHCWGCGRELCAQICTAIAENYICGSGGDDCFWDSDSGQCRPRTGQCYRRGGFCTGRTPTTCRCSK